MSKKPPIITPAQRIAIESIAGGDTRVETCAKAGVCHKTLGRWLDLPHFSEAVDEEIERNVRWLRKRLRADLEASIDVLRTIRDDVDVPAKTRAAAAAALLDRSGLPRASQQTVEVTGPGGGPLRMEDLSALSSEELLARRNSRRNREPEEVG